MAIEHPGKPETAAGSHAPRSSMEPAANGSPAARGPRPDAEKRPSSKPDKTHADTPREVVDTIAFVVVLVLLLKSFVAEAFVIPTGSMATTLLGLHLDSTCEKCRYEYLVNVRSDDDNNIGGAKPAADTNRTVCPNCRHVQGINPKNLAGGDKVLVGKTIYDLAPPKRLDVIVFKFPGSDNGFRRGGPQEHFVAKNYIKRLWGLPGETLAIVYGNVHLARPAAGDGGKELEIIRKPPPQMLEMRRIVYDNDFQASDLKNEPPRWQVEGDGASWKASPDGKSWVVQPAAADASLRYRHLIPAPVDPDRPGSRRQVLEPQLITDFLAYNETDSGQGSAVHWVSDLMLEAELDVKQSRGQVVLELVSGMDQHHAVLDLATGNVVLDVLRKGRRLQEPKNAATRLNQPGKHSLRFANFDQRLTLWIDGKLVPEFGDGVAFAPPRADERGPCVTDLAPAGIRVRDGDLGIGGLKLWRDIYYTKRHTTPDLFADSSADRFLSLSAEERRRYPNPFDRPEKWARYYNHEAEFYTVAPEGYFALGDNSTRSSDSRDWGSVPERLLLGKAVAVYWPATRIGLIW